MKKWLLTGTLISMRGAFSACSDDSNNDPVGPADSDSSTVPDSSTDIPAAISRAAAAMFPVAALPRRQIPVLQS